MKFHVDQCFAPTNDVHVNSHAKRPHAYTVSEALMQVPISITPRPNVTTPELFVQLYNKSDNLNIYDALHVQTAGYCSIRPPCRRHTCTATTTSSGMLI